MSIIKAVYTTKIAIEFIVMPNRFSRLPAIEELNNSGIMLINVDIKTRHRRNIFLIKLKVLSLSLNISKPPLMI